MTDHKQNPAEIFLIEVFDGEDYSHIWCDTPAPGEGMHEEDATRYVRADLVPTGNDVLAQRTAELTSERDALEQEAKIHASELDTQKSIVFELCNLFGLRVHDYHCISKVKQVVEEIKAQALDDAREEIIQRDIYHTCADFLEVRAIKIRQSANGGE